MFADRLTVTGLLQLRETVAKMADAGDDEFLRAILYQHLSIGVRLLVRGSRYLCGGNIGGRPDPFYCVPDFLNGIDERPDVASDIIEQVHSRHSEIIGRRSRGECLTLDSLLLTLRRSRKFGCTPPSLEGQQEAR